MSTSYTRFNIEDLPLEENPSGTDLLEVAVATENGYAMKRETAAAIADAIVNDYEYTQDLNTTSKKITGAINEVMSAKADITSLATVATSGAYSDLSGKPTIDTELDDTSTNAVENRAVASEINSIKSDITVEGSASGDIATFVDGSDNPLKELKISIEAVQSGSGDPSPTNVRPITGWTGANVTKTGVNIYNCNDFSSEDTYYFDSTGTSVPSVNYYTSNFIRVKPNTYYYYAINGVPKVVNADHSSPRITFYNEQKEYISLSDAIRMGTSFQTPNNCAYIRVPMYRFQDAYLAAMITEGTTEPTTYSAFGTTYPITWQSTAGTVYGGTLDVKTGVLTVTHATLDMGSLRYYTGFNGFYTDSLRSTIKYGTDANNVPSILAPIYKTLSFNSFFNGQDDFVISMVQRNYSESYNGFVVIKDSRYTTPEELKQGLDGIMLVYPLATPVTYQLTPTQVRSLLGVNNVWADCGAVTELKYTRDLNLCINDIIARIEALEGGSNSRSLSVSPVLTKSLTSELDTAEGKTEETEEETKEEAQNRR